MKNLLILVSFNLIYLSTYGLNCSSLLYNIEPSKSEIIDNLKKDAESKKIKVSTQEIKAVLENFSNKDIFTGETGVFKIGREYIYDINSNVIGAYVKYRDKLNISSLTVDDLINIKYDSHSFIIQNEKIIDFNKGKSSKLKWKSESNNNRSIIDGELANSVKKSLKEYNINYKEIYDSTKTKILKTEIIYDKDAFEQLNHFAKKINNMVNAGIFTTPEIVSKLIQDFLIIHPFDDGNGRIARLLGQIYYKKLKSTSFSENEVNDIIFPESFKNEMQTEYITLAKSLAPDTRFFSVSDPQTIIADIAPSNVLNKAEHKLEKILIPNKTTEEKYIYNIEPQYYYNKQNSLFWGGPVDSIESGLKKITNWMSFGRQNRYDYSKNIPDLVGYIDEMPNQGLFSTTISPMVAIDFAQGKYGIYIVIDSKNSFGVDVTGIAKMVHNESSELEKSTFSLNERFERARDEVEVSFPNISPYRIREAYILKFNKDSVEKLVRVVNPNFKY